VRLDNSSLGFLLDVEGSKVTREMFAELEAERFARAKRPASRKESVEHSILPGRPLQDFRHSLGSGRWPVDFAPLTVDKSTGDFWS
jgi:hypothetical protein